MPYETKEKLLSITCKTSKRNPVWLMESTPENEVHKWTTFVVVGKFAFRKKKTSALCVLCVVIFWNPLASANDAKNFKRRSVRVELGFWERNLSRSSFVGNQEQEAGTKDLALSLSDSLYSALFRSALSLWVGEIHPQRIMTQQPGESGFPRKHFKISGLTRLFMFRGLFYIHPHYSLILRPFFSVCSSAISSSSLPAAFWAQHVAHVSKLLGIYENFSNASALFTLNPGLGLGNDLKHLVCRPIKDLNLYIFKSHPKNSLKWF